LFSQKNIEKNRFNFLLITIDTLRPDRLSCYSSEHLKTPNIDSLSKKGVLFTRAFAHTPTTLPSHTNVLLGVLPLYHGVHDNSTFIVQEKFLTLAEHLKDSGYSTGAFVGAYLLASKFGLNQGFDIYDDDIKGQRFQKRSDIEREADKVVDHALEWLKSQKSTWFLWIHCFDPHFPYEPPQPFKTQYEKDPYSGEVAYVDSVLGKLFNYLKNINLSDKTLIVFTADHGESLGEHGEETHAYFAYNSAIWVPLIISIPGVAKGHVDQVVSHIDIFPTVCDILRIEKPPFLQGISLLPAIKGKRLAKRPVYIESMYPYYSRGWAPSRGYIYGGEKFIDSPIPEFYDLKKDFNELKNLAGIKKIEGCRQLLAQLIKTQSLPEGDEGERQKVDRESIQKLSSLGYISSPQTFRRKSFSAEDDIKVLLPYHYKAVGAMELYREGRGKEGMELLKGVITERKDIDVAYLNLATIYKEEGLLREALEVLRLGLESLPSNYEIFSTYVNFLIDNSQYEDVIEIIKGMNLRQSDYDPELWNYLGIAYANKRDFEMAIAAYEKALSIENNYPVALNNLGTVYLSLFLETKDPEVFQKSLESFKKAIELNPDYAAAYNGLGGAYRQAGNLNGAIYCWEEALKLKPDFDHALYNLGAAYLDKGDKARALDLFNKYKSYYYNFLPPGERKKLDDLIQKCRHRP
jgi:arylsulfatase A-like enzyme/Flp pilus assembly protein TadD